MYDFANLLFSGRGSHPCNARCQFCIGKHIDPRLEQDNLSLYPPHNLDRFIEQIEENAIRQVVFTGTNTDPQLYTHERRLIEHFRQALPDVQISLHTNGRLALRKMAVFNRYDRVSLSLPAFDPALYRKMMGVPGPPDLAEILRQARVPVKISCVVTDDNAVQIGEFLETCRALGIRRVVLRKLYGEPREWGALLPQQALRYFSPYNAYRGNPIYGYRGMQVTLWDFQRAQITSINLFSTGEISNAYLLVQPDLNI